MPKTGSIAVPVLINGLRHMLYCHHIHQFALRHQRQNAVSGVSYQCRENDRQGNFPQANRRFPASAKASLLDCAGSSAQYDARMSALRTTPSMAVVKLKRCPLYCLGTREESMVSVADAAVQVGGAALNAHHVRIIAIIACATISMDTITSFHLTSFHFIEMHASQPGQAGFLCLPVDRDS